MLTGAGAVTTLIWLWCYSIAATRKEKRFAMKVKIAIVHLVSAKVGVAGSNGLPLSASQWIEHGVVGVDRW
jgi:hypothetical protein